MSESIAGLLSRLKLEEYAKTFAEEELTDVALLHSMGDEMLRDSMSELGMEAAHVEKLAKDLFGGAAAVGKKVEKKAEEAEEDEPLALEENEGEVKASTAKESSAASPAVSDASKRAAERVKVQGNDALKQGKLTEAVSLYGQAIGLDPTNAVYYSNRSSAFASLNQLDKALADAEVCVRLKPEWAKGHLRLAGALSGLRRHEDAKRAFAAAAHCEPSNKQIKALLQDACEAASDQAELSSVTFDWMAEVNDRVQPREYYDRGLEQKDDAPMTFEYRQALQGALDEVESEEGKPALRTAGGGVMVVEQIGSTSFEKINLITRRSTSTKASEALKGVSKHLAVKLWHVKRDWRDEQDDEAAVFLAVRRAADEHSRIRQLAGCKHWLQLVADVAAEKEARIGGETYPAIYLEHFPGKDVTELIKPMKKPPRPTDSNKKRPKVPPPDWQVEEDDDSEDDDEAAPAKVTQTARVWEEWQAAVRAFTPEKLAVELETIKTIALGVLRGMREANEVGLRFASDGSEGPFLADVVMLDAKVKLVDTEPLGPFGEGEDTKFTAEPLVYSPLGDYIRSWWDGTAAKLGMGKNELCKDDRFQQVLNSYGTLNWLLFKWPPEELHGDEIIHLLVHGPEAAAPTPDPTMEAHWEDFMNRCFVMLGPRRFDEIREINDLVQANEIDYKDLVARSRYVMGREFENMHEEYLGLLKQAGVKLN